MVRLFWGPCFILLLVLVFIPTTRVTAMSSSTITATVRVRPPSQQNNPAPNANTSLQTPSQQLASFLSILLLMPTQTLSFPMVNVNIFQVVHKLQPGSILKSWIVNA